MPVPSVFCIRGPLQRTKWSQTPIDQLPPDHSFSSPPVSSSVRSASSHKLFVHLHKYPNYLTKFKTVVACTVLLQSLCLRPFCHSTRMRFLLFVISMGSMRWRWNARTFFSSQRDSTGLGPSLANWSKVAGWVSVWLRQLQLWVHWLSWSYRAPPEFEAFLLGNKKLLHSYVSR